MHLPRPALLAIALALPILCSARYITPFDSLFHQLTKSHLLQPSAQMPMDRAPSPPNQNTNPQTQTSPSSSPSDPNGPILLSDIISTDRRISIFSSLTRDVSAATTALDDPLRNATVLAPLNAALTALPHKPWEDASQYAALGAQAYAGQDGSARANRNLERFVLAHVVARSPWREGERVERLAGVGGGEVWWEKKDGKSVIQPGNVEVVGVADGAANGEVWVLNGVLE